MTFQRITTNPEVCGGKPCIRDMRFPVSRLLGLLAAGERSESILKSYPYLEHEDIREALRYVDPPHSMLGPGLEGWCSTSPFT